MNKNQEAAINHNLGPMSVLAGPGSGKTTVILNRILKLIESGVKPNRILTITFSKAATIELEKRFSLLCENRFNTKFNTFHSLCFRILNSVDKMNVTNVLSDEYEIENVINTIARNNKIIIEDVEELKSILREISYVKNELIPIENYYAQNFSVNDFRQIFMDYEQYKKSKNLVDFDDMLIEAHRALEYDVVLKTWQSKFDYILVDEFQDTNTIQYEVAKMLAEKHSNFFVVGDDDQCIYSFRSAKPELLINFNKYFENCKKVILDINYRSTKEIIKLSNVIIKENEVRVPKRMKGTAKEGKLPRLIKTRDTDSEAKYICDIIIKLNKEYRLEDTAILYRNNMQGRPFVKHLMDLNMPFQIKEGSPSIFEHYIAKDILAYLKLSMNFLDDESALRIFNKPTRYIKKNLIMKYKGQGVLDSILKDRTLESYQKTRVYEFKYILKNICKKNPYDAIRFIRKTGGYDDYIFSYASFRKIKPKGLIEILDEILESSQGFETFESFFEYCEETIKATREAKDIKNSKGIVLSTFHGAKGLEFENVFIITCNEGVVPSDKATTKEEIEEERRVFYVGITRAKENLYLSSVEYRHEEKVERTRFLNCIAK
ncbi:MAG: ATP-dependent helicase [Lachnospirales bacterium]